MFIFTVTFGTNFEENLHSKIVLEKMCYSDSCFHHLVHLPSSGLSDLLKQNKKTITVAAFGDSVMQGAQDKYSYVRGKQIGTFGFGPRFTDFLSEIMGDDVKVIYDSRARSGQASDYMFMCEFSSSDTPDIVILETVRDTQQDLLYLEILIRSILSLKSRPVIIFVDWLARLNLEDSWLRNNLTAHYSLPSINLGRDLLHKKNSICFDTVRNIKYNHTNDHEDSIMEETGARIFDDLVHPNTNGHNFIVCLLERLVHLALQRETYKKKVYPLPDPLYIDSSLFGRQPKCFSMITGAPKMEPMEAKVCSVVQLAIYCLRFCQL